MTELTRLLDMIRDVGPCILRIEKEIVGSKCVWTGAVWVTGGIPTKIFGTNQQTPDAVVAELVLQVGEWLSKQDEKSLEEQFKEVTDARTADYI